MTRDFVRTVDAFDAQDAAEQVKAIARGEGHRVRTVKSVTNSRRGDMPIRKPEWTVTLAVES